MNTTQFYQTKGVRKAPGKKDNSRHRDPETGLNQRQLSFCLHYLEHGNPTEAYIHAYDPEQKRTKLSIGMGTSKLMSEPNVKKFIHDRRKEAISNTSVTLERIVAELAKIGFSNITEFVDNKDGTMAVEDFNNLTPDQKACIKSYKQAKKAGTMAIELHSKLDALKMLGTYHGMFTGKSKDGDAATMNVNIQI